MLTDPDVPGLEVHLPKGTVVTGHDGRPVTELSITELAVQRPPFPLPPGVNTPVYFTVQPGAAYLSRGARIVYPNRTGLKAGERVDFWHYDPEQRGWYVYGKGTVTRDRRQIVPDADTKIYELTGSMINVPGLRAALFNMLNDVLNYDGDPVDLATGLFHERHTDLVVPDVIPISVTRTYRQLDTEMRPFGIGTNFEYGIFLQSAQQYVEADLVFPDSSKVHFVRTSPGGGAADAIFAAVGTDGPFRNATLAWNGNGWDLTRTDGTVYVFGDVQPLQAIRDRHGNQVTITRTNGRSGNITQVTSPGGHWIRFWYDTGNRITQIMDDAGRVVTYGYDTAGRLIRASNPHPTFYGYDTSHRMTTITDPRGITYLTNTYDAAGKVATQRLADGGMYYFSYSPDATGYSTQTLVRDPLNRTRLVTYDNNHYPATDTQAWGSGMQRTVTTVRDPVTRQVQRITDPYGRSTTFTYDAAGQVASISEYVGVASGRTTYFSYGAPFGQISAITDWGGRQTRFAYNTAGDMTQVTDAAGRRTSTVHDTAGRPIQTIDPLGYSTFLGYELGDPVRLTDRLGRVTRTVRDAIGRPVATTSPSGATSYLGWFQNNQVAFTRDAFGYVTSYSYDTNGNLVMVTDSRGSRIQYGYDSRDRLVSRTNQLGFVSNVYYDPLDRPVWARDERGKVTQRTYDALGRLAFEQFGVNPSPMPPQLPPPGQTYEGMTQYDYDTFDRLTRLVDTQGGTTSYTYDPLDQLTGETTAAGQILYTYDAMGRRATMSAPGAATVSYGYDPTDLLSTLTQGTTSVSWQRDGAARISRIVAPGVTTAYGYDVENEPTAMAVLKPDGAMLANMAYTWDADGRLASASGSLAMLRITPTSPSMTYNAADQLINRGGVPLSYDAAGNLLSDGTTTYSWDARGRMTGASRPGMSATYTYDSLDRRTDKNVNGARTSYLYDGPNVVREQAPAWTAHRLGAGADETLVRTENGTSQTIITDQLGSTRALVATTTSAISTQYGYDPYGTPLATGLSSNNTQQYTGREYDTETGLQNNRARYYSPLLGRFISQDPADIGGGSINMYEYSHSDPVNLSDPNGDCVFCLAPAFVSACVANGVVDAFVNWAVANVSERKYSVRDAARDFAVGCITGIAMRAVQVVMLYRTLARHMVSGRAAVVTGHHMKNRVIPAAKALGAKWFRAAGKSGNTLFWVTSERQARWARWVVGGGYRVFDVGRSPFNPFRRSIFIEIEKSVFRAAGHEVTKIPWWWWELWR